MRISRNMLVWLLAIVLLTLSFGGFGEKARRDGGAELAFSEFMNSAENKQISEVTIEGPHVYGTFTDGRKS